MLFVLLAMLLLALLATAVLAVVAYPHSADHFERVPRLSAVLARVTR